MGSQATVPSDEELVNAAKKGDRQAFSRLVERYQDRIYELACRTLADPIRGQDASQEAFIRAWRALPGFKEQSKFSSWLYRIALNCCLSEVRRRGLAMMAVPPEEIEELRLPRGAESFSQDIENKDLIQKLLNNLSPVYRSIVVLHYLNGLDCQEISGIVNRPVGTIKAYLHRARAQLRENAQYLLRISEPAR